MNPGSSEMVPHAHLWPLSTSVKDGQLQIADVQLNALADEYGTPLYILDGMTIRTQAARYSAAFQHSYAGSVHIHYASKALLNIGIAQLMKRLGLGLDVVSAGEFHIAQQAGMAPQQIHLHGNATPTAELQYMLERGVGRIIIDNLEQIQVLHTCTKNRSEPQAILLRIAPDSADLSAHQHIQTGAAASKFGLPVLHGAADQAVEQALRCPGLQLDGLHMHIGSQLRDWQALREAINTMFDFIGEMHAKHGWMPRVLSPGGGLAVAYRAEDQVADIDRYAMTISQAVMYACQRRGLPLPQLVIEPGRSMIARSGVAIYRITGSKHVHDGPSYIHIDGGMGDNIRPALYNAPYTALLIEQPQAAASQTVHVAGRYCESGDILIRDLHIPQTKLGDLLAVPMAGAYTLSMSSTYNGVPRPALLLLEQGRIHVLQRRETFDDLLIRDQPLTVE